MIGHRLNLNYFMDRLDVNVAVHLTLHPVCNGKMKTAKKNTNSLHLAFLLQKRLNGLAILMI